MSVCLEHCGLVRVRPPCSSANASWSEFAGALGRLGRPRSDDPVAVREEIAKVVGAVSAEDAVRALRQAGLAASAVNSVADLVREPHVWSRGDLVRQSDGDKGEIVMQGIVPIMSRTRVRRSGTRARTTVSPLSLITLSAYRPATTPAQTGW